MKNIFRFSVMIMIAVLLGVAPSAAQTGAVLNEIALQKEGRRLNVLLKVEGTYTYEASFSPAPPRLVIDLTPMSQLKVLPFTQIDDIGVIDIRAGQYKPDTARVVFGLSQNIPAYTITRNSEGLKITFWYEGEVPPIQAPVREQQIAPIEKKAPAATEEVLRPKRTNFFVSVRAGISMFLASELVVEKTFSLYGETGTLNEAYAFDLSPSYEIQFGKYVGRTKLGLNFSYSKIGQTGTFTVGLPHPFAANALRQVDFEAVGLKNETWFISAFALFSLVETEKFGFSAGPIIGLAKGRVQALEDFQFSERSPYSSNDITISNLVFAKEPYTNLLFGGQIGLEYGLNERLSLIFDARIIYLSPKNTTLNQRANQFHFQPVLGIQYNF